MPEIARLTGGSDCFELEFVEREATPEPAMKLGIRLHAAGLSLSDTVSVLVVGGYVGLRAFEVPQICPKHVKRTEDGDHYRLRVPEGKDTTGNGGKPRDAYLPPDVEGDIHRYTNADDINSYEPVVDLSERGIRDVVKRTAERAAEETGDDDFRYVSSHDLRRRYAQRLLVDEQVNPRVVMQVGGWDSFQAIEPYLNAPTPEVVNEAFEEAGLV